MKSTRSATRTAWMSVLGVGAARLLSHQIEAHSLEILYKQNPEPPQLAAPEARQ